MQNSGLSNYGYQMDELETYKRDPNNYTIPKAKIDRSGRSLSTSYSPGSEAPPDYNDVETIVPSRSAAGGPSTINHRNSKELQLPDEEHLEDYSLLSYLNCFECYRNFTTNRSRSTEGGLLSPTLRKRILVSIFVILYTSFFVAVLLTHSKIQEEDNYWCDADGLLIVITAIAGTGIFYFNVFKPFVISPIFRLAKRVYKDVIIFQKIGKLLCHWFFSVIIVLFLLCCLVTFLVIDTAGDRTRLVSAFGIVILLLFGFLFSASPRKVIWRHVIWGLGLQFLFGLFILRWNTGKEVFSCLGSKVDTFLKFTDDGSRFIFGGQLIDTYSVFAFKVLSVVLYFSFFVQILYYYGIMQWIVIKLGWVLQVTVGTTACESVNASANIFLGQTEAPLIIKPYLSIMTKSELHAVMTGGFATIAGSVLAAYISFGVSPSHLLSASVMSAPAALGFAKLFYPEVEVSKTTQDSIQVVKGTEVNVLHAACEGVSAAVPLVANIAANLLAFIAFIAFIDAILNWGCMLVDLDDGVCSLSTIFGYIFMPLAFIMGVPWDDCYNVGQLIGTKTFVNEFVAYLKLSKLVDDNEISFRARTIATYALCGFSNISSIGVQVGGLGSLAPDRKRDLASVALRAMIAGNIACFLTACVAGTLLQSEELVDASLFNSTSPDLL